MIIPAEHGNLVTTFRAAGRDEDLSFNMGYLAQGDGVAEGAEGHAQRFYDILDAHAQLGMPNEISIIGVTAYYNAGAGPLQVGFSSGPALVGSLGIGAAPPNVCTLTRKNTGLAGRRYRGRAFLWAMRDVDIDSGGNLTSTAQAQVNPILQDILDDMNDSGVFGWSMPARLLHTDVTPPTAIISWVVDPVVGTQRRRQR